MRVVYEYTGQPPLVSPHRTILRSRIGSIEQAYYKPSLILLNYARIRLDVTALNEFTSFVSCTLGLYFQCQLPRAKSLRDTGEASNFAGSNRRVAGFTYASVGPATL